MNYRIDFDKTVNRLVPRFMNGRKYILFLQSLVYPLQSLNDSFVENAAELRIDACMTSQVIKLVWYLNRKFSSYFMVEPGGSTPSFNILEHKRSGQPIYHEAAYETNDGLPHNQVYHESETFTEKPLILRRVTEQGDLGSHSFVVEAPSLIPGTISESDYVMQIQNIVDKYKLANKTYKINIV